MRSSSAVAKHYRETFAECRNSAYVWTNGIRSGPPSSEALRSRRIAAAQSRRNTPLPQSTQDDIIGRSQVRRRLAERGPFWRYGLAAFLAAIIAMVVGWAVGSITKSVEVFIGMWLVVLLPAQLAAAYVATPSALRGKRMGIFLLGASAAIAQPCGEWLGLQTYMGLGRFGLQLARHDRQLHFTMEIVDAAIRTSWLIVWWGLFAFAIWLAWLAFAPRLSRAAAQPVNVTRSAP